MKLNTFIHSPAAKRHVNTYNGYNTQSCHPLSGVRVYSLPGDYHLYFHKSLNRLRKLNYLRIVVK